MSRLHAVGAIIVLWLGAACAPAPRPLAERDALFQEAARECEQRYPTVRVLGIDHLRRLNFEFRSTSDHNLFIQCYQQQLQEKGKNRVIVGAGRLTETSRAQKVSTVPVELIGGRLAAPASLNGVADVMLLLDTGADLTVISPRTADRVGLSVPPSAPTVNVTVAGGAMLVVPMAIVRSMRVGDLTVENIDVGVYDIMPASQTLGGVLGANFLNHFRVTVDRDARRMTLEVTRASK